MSSPRGKMRVLAAKIAEQSEAMLENEKDMPSHVKKFLEGVMIASRTYIKEDRAYG